MAIKTESTNTEKISSAESLTNGLERRKFKSVTASGVKEIAYYLGQQNQEYFSSRSRQMNARLR